MGKTLAEKIWEDHIVRSAEGEPDLLYIDLQLIHEVTSAQAFDGLRLAGRQVRRPDLTIATEDHNTPTLDILKPIADPVSKLQIDTLRNNAKEFGIRIHSLGDADQGVVHVVGPQLGITQPGMTIVCGDSHTSTHGAFGAIAFGIGTSEVEHVLATQTLPSRRPKTMAINVEGTLKAGVTAKDIILAIIAQIGTGGGQGYIIEYRGSAIRELSMEGRMTVSTCLSKPVPVQDLLRRIKRHLITSRASHTLLKILQLLRHIGRLSLQTLTRNLMLK
jgi:3-isopropylmalate/(R)-2-methylmalate dehydratase large subunit